jgi:hypothetical protein
MANEYGTVGKMRIGEETRNILRKAALLPQIPYDLKWE